MSAGGKEGLKGIILLIIIIPVILISCGNAKDSINDDGGTETVSDISQTAAVSQPAAESLPKAAAPPTSYISPEMFANATKFASVNTARLEAVMRKAAAKEPVTVAVIGGSITQGTAASSADKCYAAIMRDWWKQTFPDTEITYVNAGIGGTDSYLGVHRMGPDLLDHKPDFVIVEYSVNDADTNFYKTTYENVVRRILLRDNAPAVMLLYMTQDNGTSAQAAHGFTGFYYELPQLSYHDMIMNEVNSGGIKWADISPDNIHPNDKGHAVCGELIWKYLNNVLENMKDTTDVEYTVKAAPLTSDAYINAHILDNRSLNADTAAGFETKSVAWDEFKNGWSAKNGGSITFTVNAKRIGILYYRSLSDSYGTAEIQIDGTSVRSVDSYFKGGWGNSVYAQQVFSEKETAQHTVTVTVPEGKAFDILGILISD